MGDVSRTDCGAGATDVRSAIELEGEHSLSPWQREYKTALSAGCSSMVSTLVGFPFDSVKTRMQTYKFNSMLHCVLETKRTEGLAGFFRGVSAPLVSITTGRTLSFSIYAQCKIAYGDALKRALGPAYADLVDAEPAPASGVLAQFARKDVYASMPIYFLSGATAGACVSLFACPFEFTKLSTQIEMLMARASQASLPDSRPEPHRPRGTIESARNIVQRRGLLGLYSGFSYGLARDCIGTALYFTVYESLKKTLMASNGPEEVSPLVIAFSGGMCGILSWSVVFPIDTMKSIFQRDILTRPPGTPPTRRTLSLSHPRMYRGIGASIVRTGVVNMTFFSIYERLFNYL
ncbi:mitochondrial carrier domain-containing protein [Dipodascopsis tothii]|uniref:mitochondrial carrier domain-containing protein n=1 Tax=Dipodascopsis tothii TaxID=44089 RepID=UPI0034CD8384